jgi:membrane fusion protein (multidrug efflux system)
VINRKSFLAWALCLGLLVACGGKEEGGRGGGGGRGMPGGAGGGEQTSVPVEVTPAARRNISAYIETNGTLEAENEVDLVSRVSGPIVELHAEETMKVSKGQLLARIDSSEIEAQLELSRVTLNETQLAFERAQRLRDQELLSLEAYEDAKAASESAKAQFNTLDIQLGYTSIEAPFAGLIIERYIKSSQHVGVGESLFRLSDFDPLLCPIQVPERNIPSLRTGQSAHLKVEAWPDERFEARVLRISPVVESATGTVRVTLEVSAKGRLRPGMFASVFLETETRSDAIVIPKAALALESIGDTVYVAGDGVAIRREVQLGFREGDWVEILSGVGEGENVVTVGQDGLAEGTPIQVLEPGGGVAPMMVSDRPDGSAGPGGPGGPAGEPSGSGSGQRPDFSNMTPEQLEAIKGRMRERGMTDEQIEARIKQMRERAKDDSGDGSSGN